MNRPALILLGAAFIAAGADAAIAEQTRDPDAYLRTLAAVSSQAAHSARASCLSRRSGNQVAYNQCLRAAFLAAGGPASAPAAPDLTPPERPERPVSGLSLEPLAGPPRPVQRGRASSVQDCPTLTECAVVIGAFTSAAVAQRELEVTASRFPELREPFNTYIRPVTASNGTQTYQTAFINGTRAEAHALCDAIKVAGRTCVVARQVPARSPASDADTLAGPSRNTSGTSFGEQTPSSWTGDLAGVQIGAFSSSAIADREYAAVASRFASYASGAEKRVQAVTAANGSTVYRTTFSGMSRDRAVAFCSALKAAGRDCVVR